MKFKGQISFKCAAVSLHINLKRLGNKGRKNFEMC